MPESTIETVAVVAKSKRGRKPPREGYKSPSALEFALIYNQASSNQDALAKFEGAKLEMSYGSLLARVKGYTDPTRKGGVIKLKAMPAGQRGRKIDADAINAAIEAAANAATVVAAASEASA